MSDVVYCHTCDNEWFRDDWGLTCPHCDSEATEIVSTFLTKRGKREEREGGGTLKSY